MLAAMGADQSQATNTSGKNQPRSKEIKELPGQWGRQSEVSRQEIQQTIRHNLGQIRQCYEKFLDVSPNWKGKNTVRFVINVKGGVETVKIIDGKNVPKLTSCMKAHIRRWIFPKPRGHEDVTVTYPFIFSPNKKGDDR
jgi:TonB family protein